MWDAQPDIQLFANISRSAEVPTFDANSFASPASSNLEAQRATFGVLLLRLGHRSYGNRRLPNAVRASGSSI